MNKNFQFFTASNYKDVAGRYFTSLLLSIRLSIVDDKAAIREILVGLKIQLDNGRCYNFRLISFHFFSRWNLIFCISHGNRNNSIEFTQINDIAMLPLRRSNLVRRTWNVTNQTDFRPNQTTKWITFNSSSQSPCSLIRLKIRLVCKIASSAH